MNRTCLVHVFGPQNVLPAVAAVRWHGFTHHNGIEGGTIVVLLHTPGWSIEKTRENLETVTKLCSSQQWPAPIIITTEQIDAITQASNDLSHPETLTTFRGLFAPLEFTEVYYAHDVMGKLPQLMMRAYPNAEKITYGESMGWLVHKDYVIAQATNAGWDEDAYQRKKTPPLIQATEATLILPADSTGDCLTGMNLNVVPRSLVLSTLQDFRRAATEVESASKELLSKVTGTPYLFILSNLTDCNSTTLEQEAAFYEESLREIAPKGSQVILKPHPLSVAPIAQTLTKRIEQDYAVTILPHNISRYPMEMWQTLISSCEVLSLSYCTISLEYVFRKHVHFILTKERIEKYIKKSSWNYFHDQYEVFSEQSTCLKKWNGKGVFWTGKRISHAPQKVEPPATSDLPQCSAQKNITTDDLNIMVNEGIELFNSGNIAEAIRVLSKAHQHFPLAAQVSNLIGLIYQSSNDHRSAINFLTHARLHAPHDKEIVKHLSSSLQQCNETSAARAMLDSYVKQHPEDLEIQALRDTLGGALTPAYPPLVLQGSWAECASYLTIHPSVIIGPGAHVDVRYRPHHAGKCVTIGADSQMFGTISILRPGGKVSIGERTQIGASTLITADEISIGNDVLIAWGITLMDNDSHSLVFEERKNDVLQCAKDWRENPRDFIRNKDWSKVKTGKITIEDKAWIGFGVAILKGVTIGEGAVVGAQSVITKDVPPYTVVAGNPARIIRTIPRTNTEQNVNEVRDA